MSLARWWPLRRLPGNFGSPLARFTHPQLSARSTSGAAQSQQATAAAPSRPVGAAGVPPPPPSPPVASSQPVGAKRGPALTPAGMVATRSAAAAQAAEECRLERVVANLQACCSAAPVAPPVSSKFAAVLVPLFEDPASGEVHVVLNQRSSKLKTHSGEGGRGRRRRCPRQAQRCGCACAVPEPARRGLPRAPATGPPRRRGVLPGRQAGPGRRRRHRHRAARGAGAASAAARVGRAPCPAALHRRVPGKRRVPAQLLSSCTAVESSTVRTTQLSPHRTSSAGGAGVGPRLRARGGLPAALPVQAPAQRDAGGGRHPAPPELHAQPAGGEGAG